MKPLSSRTRRTGFTLIEAFVVIAIFLITGAVAYVNLYSNRQQAYVSSSTSQIVSLLRQAQARSLSQMLNSGWGVHFDNVDTNAPFYALFQVTATSTSYASATAQGYYRLSPNVCYANIDPGSSVDVIFSQVSGQLALSNPIEISMKSCNGSGVSFWSSSTPLTSGIFSGASAAANGYLYSIGGITAFGPNRETSAVTYARIFNDGSLGSWMIAPSLPNPVSEHNAVAYGNYLYVTGGYTNLLGPLSSVYYASVAPNGALGGWLSASSLPTPRFLASAVAYNNYLYVIGGYTGGGSGSATSSVIYAKINNNGSLGAWSETAAMPGPKHEGSAVAYNGYIYAVGGLGSSNDAAVNYAVINTSDGSLGPWQSTASLPTTVYIGAGVQYGGRVYSIAGIAGGSTAASVNYASAHPNGTLSAWFSTAPLPAAVYAGSATTYDHYVYWLGGLNNLQVASTVYFGSFSGASTVTINPQGSIFTN